MNMTRSGWNQQLVKCGLNEIIAISQIAKVLGISPSSVRGNIKNGHLRKIDRAVVSRDDVARWLAQYPRYAAKMKCISE